MGSLTFHKRMGKARGLKMGGGLIAFKFGRENVLLTVSNFYRISNRLVASEHSNGEFVSQKLIPLNVCGINVKQNFSDRIRSH